MGPNQDSAEHRLHAHLTPALAAALEHAPEQGEEAGTMFAEAALMDALGARASDLHLDPRRDGFRLRLRVDGVALDVLELAPDAGQRLMNQFKTLAGLDPVTAVRPGEGRFTMALDKAAEGLTSLAELRGLGALGLARFGIEQAGD